MSTSPASDLFLNGIAIETGLIPIDAPAFVVRLVKVYDGASWVARAVKVYNGSSWIVRNTKIYS